jgi:AraC-like DNA-binding protein
MQAFWVSMPILRNIVLGAARTQTEIQQICAQGGITAADLDKPDVKLSLEQNCALMDAALQLSADRNLGLHIGERTTSNVLGVTGYLMETSKDLLTALHHLQEYTASFTRLYYFGIDLTADEAVYLCEPIAVWNDISPETARQSVDIAFAGTLHILRLLTGYQLHPLRIYYRYPRPEDVTEHERILKGRPLFNQTSNALIFSVKDLQRSIIGYNHELNNVFIKMLQQQHDEDQTFIQQVRTLILELSRTNFPTLEDVAARLYLVTRTLQRKLREENTSFRAECEFIKEELARNLLLSKNLPISDIADRLGYADQATFQRAFRQWTGKTPKAYRDESIKKSKL